VLSLMCMGALRDSPTPGNGSSLAVSHNNVFSRCEQQREKSAACSEVTAYPHVHNGAAAIGRPQGPESNVDGARRVPTPRAPAQSLHSARRVLPYTASVLTSRPEPQFLRHGGHSICWTNRLSRG
jgi:hypothetical protein